MKISPIAQGGTPGTNLGSVEVGASPSKEKVAAAKAAFLGQEIQVTKSDNYVDPQVDRAEKSIRKIKMRTNVSPDRFDQQVQADISQSDEVTEELRATENVNEQVNATPEDTKPLSPQFAQLAKQRRALQVKERELADREKALGNHSKDGDLVARLKSQPLSVLQEHGVTYDQLTEAILANQGGINPEIQALRAELNALKQGVDKSFSDKEAQQEQAVLSELRREASDLAKQGDDFEMVRVTNSVPDVIELIHRTYKTTGEILEVQEAMKLVEDDLINESLKIANIKKVQSRLKPAEQPQAQQQLNNQFKTMKTLTNRDSSRPVLDRKARAIAAMNGTLKK